MKNPPQMKAAQADAVPAVLLALGTLFLLVAIVASVMLAAEHLGGLSLPGCGPGSGCAEAVNSVWGKVPVIGWPVSFLGLAYFLGALVAWIASRRGISFAFRNLVRLGVVISVGFTIVMIVEKHLCQYCIASHVGNVGFWIVTELVRQRTPKMLRGMPALCIVFVLATGVLGVIEWRKTVAVQRTAEEKLAEDMARLAQAEQARAAATQAATATAPISQPAVTTAPDEPPDDEPVAEDQGFRGRYLYGPEQASVRLVVITDYQCPDCYKKEQEIRALLAKHDNVSLSVKQFPFCTDCNPHVSRTLHANACWASCAAEAAGILWGNNGFWAMHHWLFDHGGGFASTQILKDGIREIGYDPEGFIEVMKDPATLDLVKADIEEAHALGLWQTPMIFINGVELRGWYARDAVTRAVEAALAQNLPPRTHADDHPPLAVEKCVGDWRAQRVLRLIPEEHVHVLGAKDAAVSITVFGDYEEPITPEADAILRDWVSHHADAQYMFRHYPFNQECNPYVKSTKFQQGCWAARAVQAAGRVGGDAAYWRVHEWLMTQQDSLDEEHLRAAAGELGIDADALLAAMRQPDIDAAIKEDVGVGKRLRVNSIPTVIINGRTIARWRWMGPEKGREILEAILEAASTPEEP